MRGAHAARAILLLISCDLSQAAADPLGEDLAGYALAELGPAAMPSGMAGLCARDPGFCAPSPHHRSAFVLSPEGWQLLSRINDSVNHAVASTTDRALYGKDEYWTIPTTAGDCEDYVLLKRQLLMKQGMAEASLLITVVHDENGEGHAVLTVPTADGDLVLDNRRDAILRWWETGYSFIKRQSADSPGEWVSLGDEKLPSTDIASGPGLP